MTTFEIIVNQNRINKLRLVKLLKVKIDNKGMLTVKSYKVSQILDLLINREIVNCKSIEFALFVKYM